MTISLSLFWAEWDAPSADFKRIAEVLPSRFGSLQVTTFTDEADTFTKYNVSAIPTTIISVNKVEKARVVGCDAAGVHKALTDVYERVQKEQEAVDARIKELLNSRSLMLFIKGTPETPKCGFTRQLMGLLSENGITEFGYFDILSDEGIRQRNNHSNRVVIVGLKEYSNWPTYPQIYRNGELVGGLDIVKDLLGRGEKF